MALPEVVVLSGVRTAIGANRAGKWDAESGFAHQIERGHREGTC